jgi:ferric-dicitrate binding protein FerR (iron transport regulator)
VTRPVENVLESTLSDIQQKATEWTTIIDSGEMSDDQRLDFHRWLDEPRNARALGELRALVAMLENLPSQNVVEMGSPESDTTGWSFFRSTGRLLTRLWHRFVFGRAGNR